ncbi:hypothetical protein AAMO2058_001306200 [Amorphochlora amoebiformis]
MLHFSPSKTNSKSGLCYQRELVGVKPSNHFLKRLTASIPAAYTLRSSLMNLYQTQPKETKTQPNPKSNAHCKPPASSGEFEWSLKIAVTRPPFCSSVNRTTSSKSRECNVILTGWLYPNGLQGMGEKESRFPLVGLYHTNGISVDPSSSSSIGFNSLKPAHHDVHDGIMVSCQMARFTLTDAFRGGASAVCVSIDPTSSRAEVSVFIILPDHKPKVSETSESWQCGVCTLLNRGGERCEVCGGRRERGGGGGVERELEERADGIQGIIAGLMAVMKKEGCFQNDIQKAISTFIGIVDKGTTGGDSIDSKTKS